MKREYLEFQKNSRKIQGSTPLGKIQDVYKKKKKAKKVRGKFLPLI